MVLPWRCITFTILATISCFIPCDAGWSNAILSPSNPNSIWEPFGSDNLERYDFQPSANHPRVLEISPGQYEDSKGMVGALGLILTITTEVRARVYIYQKSSQQDNGDPSNGEEARWFVASGGQYTIGFNIGRSQADVCADSVNVDEDTVDIDTFKNKKTLWCNKAASEQTGFRFDLKPGFSLANDAPNAVWAGDNNENSACHCIDADGGKFNEGSITTWLQFDVMCAARQCKKKKVKIKASLPRDTSSGWGYLYCKAGYIMTEIGICNACSAGRYMATYGAVGQECTACVPGQYASETGQSLCQVCNGGKFASGNESASCIECPAGYLGEKAASRRSQCVACQPGFFIDSVGNAGSCIECYPGMYSALPGADICDDCPDGYYISSKGGTMCKQCEPGKKAKDIHRDSCVTCGPGKYADEYGTSNNSHCKNCEPGRRSASEPSQRNDCVECNAGSYAQHSTMDSCKLCQSGYFVGHKGAHSCNICPLGYMGTPERASCAECPKGQYNNEIGVGYDTLCKDCDRGRYNGGTARKVPCQLCPVGWYQSSGGKSVCYLCPNGAPTNGSFTCEGADCGVGKYKHDSQCVQCPAGQYSDRVEVDQCLDCPTGWYGNVLGQLSVACHACPEGKYGSSPGGANESWCIKCDQGKYQPDKGQRDTYSCRKCGSGRYNSEYGAVHESQCKTCPPGKYSQLQYATGEEQCVGCENGKFSETVMATSEDQCRKCPAGFVQTNPASVYCLPCAPGRRRHESESASSPCIECKEGRASSIEKNKNSSCDICENGRFTRSPGLASCTLCGAGRFGNGDGACEDCAIGRYRSSEAIDEDAESACTKCPAGRAADSEGLPSCVICLAGRFSADKNSNPTSEGAVVCNTCPEGYYSDDEKTECEACPTGWSSPLASPSCNECIAGQFAGHLNSSIGIQIVPASHAATSCQSCPAGFFAATAARECNACPTGYFSGYASAACDLCSQGRYSTILSYENQSSGIYIWTSATSAATSCQLCKEGLWSQQKAFECKGCPGGYYSRRGSSVCEECKAGKFSAIHGERKLANATECAICPSGFSAEKASDDCEPCEKGKTSTHGSEKCDFCEKGQVGKEGFPPTCERCNLSYRAVKRADGVSYCELCPIGYRSSADGTECGETGIVDRFKMPQNIQVKVISPKESPRLVSISWEYEYLADPEPCESVEHYIFVYTARYGGVCPERLNTSQDFNIFRARPGSCCDSWNGVKENEVEILIKNPRCTQAFQRSLAADNTTQRYTSQVYALPPRVENVTGSVVEVDFVNVNITLHEPAWCHGIVSPSLQVLASNSKSPRMSNEQLSKLYWTTAHDCSVQDLYLNRTILSYPKYYKCEQCPIGASCAGKLTWSDVRPFFGFYRLGASNARASGKPFSSGKVLHEAYRNNFTKCRFPPACLGARNFNMKGLFQTCDSTESQINAQRDICDPSQQESSEGCNIEAGFRNLCNLTTSDGYTTQVTQTSHICNICSRCRQGYQRSSQGLGFKCDKCPPRNQNGLRIALGSFLALVLAMLLVKLGMNDVLEGNPSDAMNRILLNFMQVLAVFAAFPLKWPTAILEMFKISQTISVLGESLVNPDCELSWSPSNIFYNKMLGWAAVPPTIIFLCFLFWRTFACCKRLSFTEEVDAKPVNEHVIDERKPAVATTSNSSNTSLNTTRISNHQSESTIKVEMELSPMDKRGSHTASDYPNFKGLSSNFETFLHAQKVGHLEASISFRRMVLSKLKQREPTPKDHFCVCSVILLYLCYPSMCKNTFRMIICTDIGGVLYLSADPEQICWVGRHLFMVLVLSLPQLLLYVIGIPLGALLVLFKNRSRLENARTKYRWGVLYVGLRRERYYWDFAVSLRKAAIFSLSALGSSGDNLTVQTHLAMLVLFLSLLAHLCGRPYEREWFLLDIFEVSGLVVCWILMWSGVVFYLDGISDGQKVVTTMCLTSMNILYASFVGIILIRQKAEEGATWTIFLRGKLLCCFKSIHLRTIGNCIPKINPATRYVREIELLLSKKEYQQKFGKRDFNFDSPHEYNINDNEERSTNRAISSGSIDWSHNPQLYNSMINSQQQEVVAKQNQLPDGWYVDRDPATGLLYYFTGDGETSWEEPKLKT